MYWGFSACLEASQKIVIYNKMDIFDEDIQLMVRFQNGEESCFEKLVERHKTRVFNIAYRFLGNYQEAEDTAQEIFIKIYNAKDTYKSKAKFTTWFYTICKNTCLNKLRKKRLKTVSIDSDTELKNDTVTNQINDSKTPTPLDSMLNNEQVMIVKKAIDSLPPNQKMTVILCRYDQLPYEDIAKIMDCSVKAVKSLLHRAKINLKENLTEYFNK
ncbi:MAG: RNA polymerase sigma factor [Elusimicrobia bacterium]|nr:RNA polymerase sigma factor [Elusimicrobiota bacterium]